MPDWRRIIVGDAFRLPSRDFNYYRDFFLLIPFLLFSLCAVGNLFTQGHEHRSGLILAGLAGVAILLAKERWILLGGSLGFCAVQGAWGFAIRHDPLGLAVFIGCGVPCIALIWFLKDYKPSYQIIREHSIVELLLGLISGGLAVLVIQSVTR